MGTERMEELQKLVDPYCYRERLTMPKFVLNATGDQFFLPDSSQFYYDELPNEKYLRYVPNTDHSLEGSDALESVLAFYLSVLHDQQRPQVNWQFSEDGALRVSTQQSPERVLLWEATNPDARDFRLETIGEAYESTSLRDQGDGTYLAHVKPPESGWKAFFVELTFDIGAAVPLKLTTSVYVIPTSLPFADKNPAQ
jgi:PhoPQ-activated pathogenicity-related protein